MKKKFNNKIRWHTNVHIYGLSLAIGDAHFLIDKIKNMDAFSDYFYNDDGSHGRQNEPEGFVNEVKDIIGKTVNCFTLNIDGLGWFPVFDSYAKGKEYIEIDGYYIDYGAADCTRQFERPKCFFDKKHIKIINSMIQKSLENKPIFNLSFPSKKILFMETKSAVPFVTEENVKVDYTKSISEIFEQLLKISNNDYYDNEKKKLTFINGMFSGTEFTYDFHIDKLSSNKFEVFKVESLEKDMDWITKYYSKYTSGKKNINDFKSYVEQHGFLNGYYLKAI